MVSLYLHFYWCSKLQIAFSSFCLCLCVEETEKKILICSNWPYINHYSEVKWCELDSSLNKTSGGRQGTLEAVLSLELFWKFCFFKWVHCLLLYCAKLELTLMQKKYTQKQDLSRLHSAFLLTHCQEHVLYITYYAGLHSSWSDTLITLLFSAQVQYGLDHYPSHFPIVTNSSHCTLRECNYLSVSELLCIRVAHLSPFSLSLLSHFLLKWVTVRRWNFIVYVFIHCEAGITDFTRSFKQMSEYSIDWNVNTGSHWAQVTQLDIQPLSSLSFIVSQRSKSVFLKLLIKLLQLLSRSGDLGK